MRIRIECNDGDAYEYTEPDSFWDNIQYGRWEAPFPNEVGNSWAYGIAEYFCQADIGTIQYGIKDVVAVEVKE